MSLQSLDPAPPSAPAATREKKQLVVDGTDVTYRFAKKYQFKLAWGTDMLFDPKSAENQSKENLKLEQWFIPAETLRMFTYDNAQLLGLTGKRNPYPGKLGVIEEGALADMLLLDGDPLVKLKLLADPEQNLLIVMKDVTVFKNHLK